MAGKLGQGGGGSRIDPRTRLCHCLGIANILKAHELIVAGAAKGADWLLKWGLNAKTLTELGYNAAAIKQLGYQPAALERLGYPEFQAPPSAPLAAPHPAGSRAVPEDLEETEVTRIRKLIESGRRAAELRPLSITVHHCKKAGYSASELAIMGYGLDELVSCCSCAELRRADFKPRELRRCFTGEELKKGGFTAGDMRIAGYGVRALLNLGYNENHIKTAGYSTAELLREGLSKLTRL